MPKITVLLLATAIVFNAEQALAADVWDCHYIHDSIYAREQYRVDGNELQLLNGVARYHILANNGFGLMADSVMLWTSPANGQTINTEFIAIDKSNGTFLKTLTFLTAVLDGYSEDRGKCVLLKN